MTNYYLLTALMGILFYAGMMCVARPVIASGKGTAAMPVQEIWFQKDIAAFEASDKIYPPRVGTILFTGSSIFRFWVYLEKDMSPLPVLNRAFGGARTWEALHYMDRIVLPYAPKIIVYYCGSNDINYGEPADAIACRFTQFVNRVHAALPQTRIIYVSIIKAPQKRDAWDVIDAANTAIRHYCDREKQAAFIDANPVFFTNQQEPRTDLYIDDGLHLKPEAYREMTKIIKPVLEHTWQELSISR